jgi:PhnB protein
MRVEPYLFFESRCDDAIDLYCRVLGAKVTALQRFKDVPGSNEQNGDKVMHASLRVGESTVLASDGQSRGAPTFQGFSLSLTAANDAEAVRLFAALADGGRVQVPLMTTPFAPRFGMVADRLGVLWTVVSLPENASQPA